MELTIACGIDLFFYVIAQIENAKAICYEKVNVRRWIISLIGFFVSIFCTILISMTSL